VPSTVRASRASILAHPAVSSLHQEADGFNGHRLNWWCYLGDGWVCTSMECGTIHEHTLAEVAALLNDSVRRVDA
jgi:hypothetical protein